MTIHYVDSNASGLNDGTSWANAYADISTAIAGSLSANDTLHVASDHLKSYSANTTLTYPDNVTVISVNSSTDVYEAGAEENTTAGVYNLALDASDNGAYFIFIGITFKAGNDFSLFCAGVFFYFKECIFDLGSSPYDQFYIGDDGIRVIIDNSTINFKSYRNIIKALGGSQLTIKNTSFTTTASLDYFVTSYGNGGASIEVENCDLSGIIAIDKPLMIYNSDNYDISKFKLTRVKLKAGQLLANDNPANVNVFTDAYSCGIGDEYHYFEVKRHEGNVLESTSVYRSGGATYDGISGFSAEFQTTSKIKAYTNPLRFKLGEYELDLTSAKTLTFHVIQQDASAVPADLTDHECWIEVVHPDTIDNALGVTVDSRTTDILDTPATLATSTETWTGTSGNVVKQQISATLPTVTGMTKAPVTVYLHLAKDVTTVDATEFFACPKVEVS